MRHECEEEEKKNEIWRWKIIKWVVERWFKKTIKNREWNKKFVGVYIEKVAGKIENDAFWLVKMHIIAGDALRVAKPTT